MNSENKIENLSPLDIVIFHIGGVGGYGPVKKVIEMFPERSVVICFEANPSEKDLLIQEKYQKRGVRTVFIPKCIGEKRGKQCFYVNKHRASSSIFPPASEAVGEHILGLDKGLNTWAENCELDYVAELDTVSLDELIGDNILPSPDILSMDTQGSEMPIMRGGQNALEDLLCMICEVNFSEIYKGQELFFSQQKFLHDRGFRIADVLNTQYWHPGPAAGAGFLTVGEALFFRKSEAVFSRFQKTDSRALLYKLIKLAAIAYAFDRVSYSSKILKLALEKFGAESEAILASDKNFKPMLDRYYYMQKNYGDYLKDNRFFYRRGLKEIIGDIVKDKNHAIRRKVGSLLRMMTIK
jgi:FkbM family methyltransferase